MTVYVVCSASIVCLCATNEVSMVGLGYLTCHHANAMHACGAQGGAALLSALLLCCSSLRVGIRDSGSGGADYDSREFEAP